MIEVRFRPDYEPDSVHVFDIPWDRLDEVIPLLKGWGIEPWTSGNDNMFGQFVYDERCDLYFEVVLSND